MPAKGEGIEWLPAVFFDLKRDLRIDSVVSDLIGVDGSFHLLDIDRFDVTHRLGGLLNRKLCGVFPALWGLGQYFDDLQYSHDNPPFWCVY